MYEMIRDQLGRGVPFAAHAGVQLLELSGEGATAALDETAVSVNHIGSQHAGALFTLGEATSGAAMAGVFAPVLLEVRPLAAGASIRYSRIARGRITATARVGRRGEDLLAALAETGRVSFAVDVGMTDESGEEVARMQVEWHVSSRRPA